MKKNATSLWITSFVLANLACTQFLCTLFAERPTAPIARPIWELPSNPSVAVAMPDQFFLLENTTLQAVAEKSGLVQWELPASSVRLSQNGQFLVVGNGDECLGVSPQDGHTLQTYPQAVCAAGRQDESPQWYTQSEAGNAVQAYSADGKLLWETPYNLSEADVYPNPSGSAPYQVGDWVIVQTWTFPRDGSNRTMLNFQVLSAQDGHILWQKTNLEDGMGQVVLTENAVVLAWQANATPTQATAVASDEQAFNLALFSLADGATRWETRTIEAEAYLLADDMLLQCRDFTWRTWDIQQGSVVKTVQMDNSYYPNCPEADEPRYTQHFVIQNTLRTTPGTAFQEIYDHWVNGYSLDTGKATWSSAINSRNGVWVSAISDEVVLVWWGGGGIRGYAIAP
ncbi:MAG TPA: hypothetical protein PK299_01225 [Anaerolineales bacterium]|nr:hypothetical protein [Anaerolineales bacterium]